jgi:Holliday junction DNA helicase RuvB
LRPLSFDFAGQDQILENLKVFVEAANQRNEVYTPSSTSGLGKTTLANILAMNYKGIKLPGPVLDKPGDLAGY